jgi:hypothetical protein
MNDSKLVLYDQMRSAIAECAAVDEVAGIKNKAIQLEAYARVRDDAESQRRFAEIRLRACMRIGEISRDLEKAEHGGSGGGSKVRPNGLSKEETLERAGIAKQTAHDYEQLVGGKEQQAQTIAVAAAESYFATQQENNEPVSMGGLKGAVREALESTFGKRPVKTKSEEHREPDLLVHFLYSPRWALEKQNFDPEALARQVLDEFAPDEITASDLFIELLTKFVKQLRERFPYVTKSTRHFPS